MPKPLLLLLSTAALAGCATAGSVRDLSEDQRLASLTSLRAADLRVATIAYRLASAGEPICPRKQGLTGISLHASSQYSPSLRAAAATSFGLRDRIAVLAVAPGSPAAVAGLRADDGIVAIGQVALAPVPASGSAKASYDAVAAAYARLEAASGAGSLTLNIERGSSALSVRIAPRQGCASRVQLRPSATVAANADGTVLSVTTALLDYVENDDELALAIAHEMAHNALGHRAVLDASRTSRGLFESGRAASILLAERAADRLSYYLVARGGYDAGVAPAFWDRLYRGPAGGRLNPRTHPARDERIARARIALNEIAAKRFYEQPLSP